MPSEDRLNLYHDLVEIQQIDWLMYMSQIEFEKCFSSLRNTYLDVEEVTPQKVFFKS